MPSGNASIILGYLTSPTAVKAAMSECDRIGREDFLKQYGFKPATEYTVTRGGSEYDSKAIAAVAFGYQHGAPPLAFDECHGGKHEGHAGWAIDRLGFSVQGINHIGWWLDEVDRTIDVYFEIWTRTRAGEKFRKSDYLKKLHDEGPKRSYKAYEYKLQNISAALNDLGHDWLQGYAPKARYQQLVRFCLEDRLGRPIGPSNTQPKKPKKEHAPKLVKIDWAKRDAENRELGIGGEKFVLERERQRLVDANKPGLAAHVRWNASEADGHGYDISSFEVDGTPIFIEVKTTTLDREAPFFVSRNEVLSSRQLGDRYRLYRVANFLSSPTIKVYTGPLEDCLTLTPNSYRARAR
jgi:hypothetical protein